MPDYESLTDMFHLKAIEMISASLRDSVNGIAQGKEAMSVAQYIAGMGFSNVGLGIVHSMAHSLGAFYDTPHGVANALLLPYVMEYNADATEDRYRDIAKAMGVENTEGMTTEEARKAAINAVRKLAIDVGIPQKLSDIGASKDDLQALSELAMSDACTPGNPKDPTVEEIKAIYENITYNFNSLSDACKFFKEKYNINLDKRGINKVLNSDNTYKNIYFKEIEITK